MMTKEEEKKIECLRRRAAWLQTRIQAAQEKGVDLSFDRSEASALGWAIRRIESFFGIQGGEGEREILIPTDNH